MAERHGGGHSGGGGAANVSGGGGGVRMAPSATVRSAPSVSSTRSFNGGGAGVRSYSAPSVRSYSAPSMARSPSTVRAPQTITTMPQRNSVATNRYVNRPGTTAATRYGTANRYNNNSVAFGGRTADRSTTRFAPREISRDWDRHSEHRWNNHRYRWDNGNWIVTDFGYYGSPYYGGYAYGYGYPSYSDEVVDYNTYSAPAETYAATDGLVADVQDALARSGYNPGPVDGVLGAQTRAAIRDYQADHGIPVTGRLDSPLLREMGI
jgi:hypothetical protein